jgi:GMP synthase-like glutamine amidotransferase
MLPGVRVLFVKQDHLSPSGLVGDAFASLGWDVSEMTVVPETRYHSPDVSVTFPAAGAFDAVAFYGAVWSVYDSAAIGTWVDDEIAFARSAIAAGVPVLGICFGGQMLAAALGGSVSLAPVPEIGWGTIDSSADMISAGPWFNWHFDRFTVPDGVPVLARTAHADQAFSVGRTLGLQFHPEVNAEVIETWLTHGGGEQLAENGADPQALLAQTRLLSGEAAVRTRELVRRFVCDVAPRPVLPPARETADAMLLTPGASDGAEHRV